MMCFVMNSINMFGNFMIFYGYNHKKDLVTLKYNYREAHSLKFTFMNFISLVTNWYGLIMNDYGNCYELV